MWYLHFNQRTGKFCELPYEIEDCWKFSPKHHNVLLKKLQLIADGYKKQDESTFLKELR